MITRRALLASVTAAVTLPAPLWASNTTGPIFSSWGLAIRGTDPVGYFTVGKPMKGRKDHEIEWRGAIWRFASAENKAAFAENPESFAPQFGGHCAYAVANGYTASTAPEAWRIVDGKLYLNYSLSVRDLWDKDVPGHIAAGDKEWPKIVANS